MSTYAIEELIKLWANGKATVDQVTGQVLLQLLDLQKRVKELERNERKAPGTAKPN